jgi:hypothetical protein
VSDLRQRVPGHSLVDELLRQWDLGTIRLDGDRVIIDEQAESWYRGVLGERRVASVLQALDDRWTVLHSVPVGAGSTDIDHVVIGQSGVFTINTKYSPGKDVWVAGRGMYVGGHRQNHVHSSLAEGKRASEALSQATGLTVPVSALIVFVDPAKITHKAAVGGGDYEPTIHVIRDTEILATVRTRPVFSIEQVNQIVDAAVQPTTWQATPAPSSRGAHISGEFAALEEALGAHLAGPLSRTSSPPRARPAARKQRLTTTYRPARPARSSRPASRNRRRKKRSFLERLLYELLAPTVGLLLMWGLLNAYLGR